MNLDELEGLAVAIQQWLLRNGNLHMEVVVTQTSVEVIESVARVHFVRGLDALKGGLISMDGSHTFTNLPDMLRHLELDEECIKDVEKAINKREL